MSNEGILFMCKKLKRIHEILILYFNRMSNIKLIMSFVKVQEVKNTIPSRAIAKTMSALILYYIYILWYGRDASRNKRNNLGMQQ